MSVTDLKPSKLRRGAGQRIRGIASGKDDIKLRGRSFTAEVTSAVTDRPTLVRSLEGASNLTIPLQDSDREIRRSKLLTERFDVELDELWFRLAMASGQGKALSLVFEDRLVSWLRTGKGEPWKVFRGEGPHQLTRAEACVAQARQVPQEIPIICPELHTVQPIKSAKEGREAAVEVDEQRGKGLDSKANLTVKGQKASSAQIDVGDRMLRVAASLKAPKAATVALMAAGIVESLLGQISPNLLQLIPSTASQAGIGTSLSAVEAQCKGFLVDDYGSGKSAGAIAVSQHESNPAHIAQAVQRSGAGQSSNGEANYGPVVKEATKWVQAFQGGGDSETSVSATITTEKPYPFERKPSETRWDSIGRLMEEVHWRRFASAGILYLIAETDLMRSRVRMRVNVDAPGIEEISDWQWAQNKKVQSLTVSARTKAWAAPPGSVAVVSGEGPADGVYLVSTITQKLGDHLAQITLKRRTKPLPEPAPETKSKTVSVSASAKKGGHAGGSDLAKWAESKLGTAEGSSRQEQWAQDLGYAASVPWCSIFVATGVKAVLHLPVPANAAYSGDWLTWSHGQKVGESGIQPGDIVVFDWGDGGRTDHVAIYVGNDQVIGGNQSDNVTKVPLTHSAIVGIVRPRD